MGPAKADAQLQVQLVEDMIAKKADAITVVPFSPEALEPVLEKARAAGIKVVTHEASNIKNADWDLEAFQNVDYGKHQMDLLADCMKGEGQYAVFVGGLTSKTHNEWVDGLPSPGGRKSTRRRELVGDRNETYDDQQKACARRRRSCCANSLNVKGFKGSASTDVAGIGLAIEERNLQDKTCVVGTQPAVDRRPISGKRRGQGDQLLGDPADAGYLMQKIAVMLLKGEPIKDGMDLGIPGYNNIKVDGKVIYGQAWVDVTKDNAAEVSVLSRSWGRRGSSMPAVPLPCRRSHVGAAVAPCGGCQQVVRWRSCAA